MVWRVTAWNRSLGRGSITSATGEVHDFDAGVATVGDFELGEEVDVEIGVSMRGGPKVAMVSPRTHAPAAVEESSPSGALGPFEGVPVCLDYRVVGFDGVTLRIAGDHNGFAYGYDQEIIFKGVDYVELPSIWASGSFRLASAHEREHLATRAFEMHRGMMAIAILDEDGRAYFVVCEGVQIKNERVGRGAQV